MSYSFDEFKKIKASCNAIKYKYKTGQTVSVKGAFNSLYYPTTMAFYGLNAYSWIELAKIIQPPEIMTAKIRDRKIEFYEHIPKMVPVYDIDFMFEYQGEPVIVRTRSYPAETLDIFTILEKQE